MHDWYTISRVARQLRNTTGRPMTTKKNTTKLTRAKKETLVRGLDRLSYQRLRYRVLAGELTWDDAIAQGLCLGRPQGRPRKELGKPKLKN
jgi:hypothetical protein